jgi:hypothetical protein
MNFRRPLSQEEGGQWDKLIVHLEGVQIGEGKDNISGGWIWGGGGGSQHTYETHVEE